jgi:hypothetical protein
MLLRRRLSAPLLLIIVALVLAGSAAAHPAAQPPTPNAASTVYLPLVGGAPLPPQPFGFDMHWWYVGPQTVSLAANAQPRWVRAADVLWSDIEPVPGQYRWDRLEGKEGSIRALRAAGIEPVVIINRTPAWAQLVPGRLCSPPAPEHIPALLRFVEALSARYKDGPTAIRYWEFWNEPDRGPDNVVDNDGAGCWGTSEPTFRGGDYYGRVLAQVAHAVRRGNPNAKVLGGALLYWVDSDYTQRFLEGMLATGGVAAADMLSFHAYGEWAAADWLVTKTNRIRAQLKRYGLEGKPLMATEVAATCSPVVQSNCTSSFVTNDQANYAARIYAEAMALGLHGAFWYTLANQRPGFDDSHLVDIASGGQPLPRPAYNAFRNSALLLQGARYIGPPVTDPTNDHADKVQSLVFKKDGLTLFVLWVQNTPSIDKPVLYSLGVHKGARARCTTNLDGRNLDGTNDGKPYLFNCSDRNADGVIPLAIGELPQYVEVQDAGLAATSFDAALRALPNAAR